MPDLEGLQPKLIYLSDEFCNQGSAGTGSLVSLLEAVLFDTDYLNIHWSRDCIGAGLPGESSNHQPTAFLSCSCSGLMNI